VKDPRLDVLPKISDNNNQLNSRMPKQHPPPKCLKFILYTLNDFPLNLLFNIDNRKSSSVLVLDKS